MDPQQRHGLLDGDDYGGDETRKEKDIFPASWPLPNGDRDGGGIGGGHYDDGDTAEKKGDATATTEPRPDPLDTRSGYSSFNDAVADSELVLPWRDSRWPTYWGILLLDVLQILMVLPFGVLAVMSFVLDGRTTQEVRWLPDVISASAYGPTVFPILFALIVGRFMKAAASHLLERRSTVKTMEQLFGSRTVVSAFVTQFKMRGFNLLGLAIVLIWVLSPVGSQASLRVASIVQVARTAPFGLSYLDPRAGYSPDEFAFSTQLAASLFTTSIMVPNRTHADPYDIWGNVRVPMVELLEKEAGVTTPGLGWHPVEGRASPVPFASLVGVPMSVTSQLEAVGRTDLAFEFDSTYWWLDCRTESTADAGYSFPNTMINYSATDASTQMGWTTMLRSVVGLDPSALPINDTEAARTARFFPWMPREVRLIANNSRTVSPRSRFAAVCNLTSTFVTVRAACGGVTSESGVFSATASSASGGGGGSLIDTALAARAGTGRKEGCRATAVRRSSYNATKSTMSLLDVIGVGRDASFLRNFLRASAIGPTTLALNAGGRVSHVAPNIGYLADPSNPFGFEGDFPDWASAVPSPTDFGVRLAQMLNTFWLASTAYKPIQGDFSDAAATGPGSGLTASQLVLNGGNFRLARAQGEASAPRIALSCNRGWTSALLVASGVLLFIASATLGLDLVRRVPDVLVSFSTLVKDNPYARLPRRDDGKGAVQLNSMFDGFQRARSIQDLVVQIGDVAPGSDNGYVAIGTPETVAMDRLRRHRKYV